MKRKTWLAVFAAFFLAATGCSQTIGNLNVPGSSNGSSSSNDSVDSSSSTETVFFQKEDMFTDRDYQTGYKESESISVFLADGASRCSSDKVTIDGDTVTITAAGVYLLSGDLSNGQIVVYTDKQDKVHLVFNGVSVQNTSSAPFYVKQTDKVFVTLAEGTENVLVQNGTFVQTDENEIDAAVFSKEDITFNGSGTLSVSSSAGHGILSKDDLTFTGGRYEVNAAKQALSGKDCLKIADGTFTLTSGKDGLHAENTDDTTLGYVYISDGDFSIDATDDGISASAQLQIANGSFDVSAEGKGLKAAQGLLIEQGDFSISSSDDGFHSNSDLTVKGGTIVCSTSDDGFHADETLTVSGGEITVTKSYEGLEGQHIYITDGSISVKSSDDGLNAAGGTDSSGYEGTFGGNDFFGPGRPGKPGNQGGNPSDSSQSTGTIVISGGRLYIQASGDGIDSNGSLTISGGEITVCGPTEGDTAVLDYDTTGVITGGTFIGTGAAMMAQSLSGSQQGVIAISVGNQSAGAIVTIRDGNGNLLFSFTPALSYQIVIVSSPAIEKNASYAVTVGSLSGTVTAQ